MRRLREAADDAEARCRRRADRRRRRSTPTEPLELTVASRAQADRSRAARRRPARAAELDDQPSPAARAVLLGRSRPRRGRGRCPRSRSTPTPASPTACGPRARPPRRVKAGEGRTRAALYQALSLAYDFAVAADRSPEEYAELLEELGVKAQARAPMTPIVKLVFGIDYDKARLTEFAAALVLRPAPGRRARRLPAVHREAARRPQGAGRGRARRSPARTTRPTPRAKPPAPSCARPRPSRSPTFRRRRVRAGPHAPRRRRTPRAGRVRRRRSVDRTRDPPRSL